MPRKRAQNAPEAGVQDFRHDTERRLNNPPAGVAPIYETRERQTRTYSYDPHLDPQLEWAGKAEHTSFEVDVVSLHIHERISTRAILDALRKPQPPQLDLFGETPLPADKEVEFYQHAVDWTNRLILGDSLLVMNSLLVKERMAGKVQMIYLDPPYGIKYASNFQPKINQRSVQERDEDLTREPEQIKAYRDTWQLGIHSYLTYLRDRLLLCRELLHESGSIFVQINDENLHLVRCLLDEVFGRENFVAVITFIKTSGKGGATLDTVNDYLLWYARLREQLKYRQLLLPKVLGEEGTKGYGHLELVDGTRRRLDGEESDEEKLAARGLRVFKAAGLTSQTPSRTTVFSVDFEERSFTPGARGWSTSETGMTRLMQAERVIPVGNTLSYVRYLDEVPTRPLTNVWTDTGIAGYGDPKVYTVQTNTKVVERCILMTTDPGDLVLDPTCGSGTTAYCAEKWGRRWITCDTSRVAIAIARQRLMTAKFDCYELKDPERGPAGGFIYETVPHITLQSIAQNAEIDAIAAQYQPQIDEALAQLNAAQGAHRREWEVPREVPHPLWSPEARDAYEKLSLAKQQALQTDDEQVKQWLETIYRHTGRLWRNLNDVPEPIPAPDWSDDAVEALRRFWDLKRAKRRAIDASIQKNAPQETLYDQPQVKRGVVRVSGPFTVEAIPTPVAEDPTQARPPEPDEVVGRADTHGQEHIEQMIQLLRLQGGILFPGGKRLELREIRPVSLGVLHAAAETEQQEQTTRVAISFGPPYGPITATQVSEATSTALMNGYPILVFAGFSFDPEAQALIERIPVENVQRHFATISPDVLVGDLLKTTRASQIFTVFGQPDVAVRQDKNGDYTVELRGVDIYDPITGEVHSTSGNQVAAWFLDTDYDGKTFHICQAFFPGDEDAWEKLQRALRVHIPEEAFERMRGVVSFPFQPGEHKRIAVKVIDFRGNEVVRVVKLETETKYG